MFNDFCGIFASCKHQERTRCDRIVRVLKKARVERDAHFPTLSVPLECLKDIGPRAPSTLFAELRRFTTLRLDG